MFRSRIVYNGVNGSKNVCVSRIITSNANPRSARQYFAVTGIDKRDERTIFLPPAQRTRNAAMHVAMRWLLAFSL